MTVTIYHNPRCTKSRLTLELLKEKGFEPKIVEYLKEAPSVETLTEIINMLGSDPRAALRKGEKAYKENHLNDPTLNNDDIIKVMVENPILIERPIVVKDKKAAIGRPPENILKIL